MVLVSLGVYQWDFAVCDYFSLFGLRILVVTAEEKHSHVHWHVIRCARCVSVAAWLSPEGAFSTWSLTGTLGRAQQHGPVGLL